MNEKLFKRVAKKLKDNGYKMTGPRLAILNYLLENEGHHTLMEIFNKIKMEQKGIGMATIYRNVNLFFELDILRVLIPRNSQPCYEINFPGDHHHHLICSACGKIVEFGSCNFTLIAGEVEKITGFNIEEHTLEAYGLCPGCQSAGKSYSKEKM